MHKEYILNLLKNGKQYSIDVLKEIRNVLNIDISNEEIDLTISNDEKRAEIVKKIYNEIDDTLLLSCVKELDDDIDKDFLIKHISDENIKIEAIKDINDVTLKYWNISDISDFDTKMNLLQSYNDEKYYVYIAKSFKNDEEKLKVLQYMNDEKNMCNIIKLMDSDDYKKNAIVYLNNIEFITDVVITFNDDENKLEYLYDFIGNDEQIKIVRSLKNDDLKKEYISQVFNDEQKVFIITSLSNDNDKYEFLNSVDKDVSKVYIINSFEDEQKRIECLDIIKSPMEKSNIIKGLSRDEDKVSLLNLYSFDEDIDDFFRESIIQTIENIDLRCEYINTIKNDHNKVRIINDIENDSIKIKLLKTLNTDLAKSFVVSKLKDDNNKIELLSSFSDDKCKTVIVSSLGNDKLKEKYLECVQKEKNKIEVVCNFKDDNYKYNYMQDKERAMQLKLAISMKDKEHRNKAIDELFPTIEAVDKIGLDKNITFGVELEAEGDNARRFYGYYGNWKTVDDQSLNKGVEFVSPVMTDNIEDLRELYKICSIMQESNLTTGSNCGGHIHIGAKYLETKEDWETFSELWFNCEKQIYMMSNSAGNITRMGARAFASPISQKMEEALKKGTFNIDSIETKNDFISKLVDVQSSRGTGINFFNVNSATKDTIEFRLSNGTIKPDEVIDNIRLYSKLIEKAKMISRIKHEDEENKNIINKYAMLLDKDIDDKKKAETLVDILFDNEECKEKYLTRYNANSKIINEMDDSSNPFKVINFGKVGKIKNKFSKDSYVQVYREFQKESSLEER